MPDPLSPLYAIVDVDTLTARRIDPTQFTTALIAGGAALFQLRAKYMSGAAFLELAERLAQLVHHAGGRLIINDRADIAAMCGADGIHLGQEDLTPRETRAIVGPETLVGLSTHSEPQIDEALREPISYFAVGPVFGTSTKDTGYDAVGLDMVRTGAQKAAGRIPLVAIGGITLTTARRVLDAGAASVAVISDLLVADPSARVRDYLKALR